MTGPTIPTCISIVNHSSVVSQADAAKAARAVQKQINDHFHHIWGKIANIYMTPAGAVPPQGYWQVVILDDSDQAGALGYHDLTSDGEPLAKVFARTDLEFGLSWTVTLSHEVLEMLVDPYVNLTTFVQQSGTTGVIFPYEVADAVEDDSLAYEIDGVLVSDFVTPEWFQPQFGPNETQFDFLNHVTEPLQLLAGGYIGYFDVTSGTGWQQKMAEMSPRAQGVSHHAANMLSGKSRWKKRLTPKTQWVKSAI